MFAALGWVLLFLGLLLLIWRLRADFARPASLNAAGHKELAARQLTGQPFGPPIPRPLPFPVDTSDGEMPIQGGPSLDARLVNAILAAYGSPLRGHGGDLVALSGRYRVDDAVALGFFVMESRAGTRGEALFTHNVGNLRPTSGIAAADTYQSYGSWMEGATEWFQLMRQVYVDSLKLDTVEAAAPVYAPSSDANDPLTMAAGIRQLVRCWRGAAAVCPSDPPGIGALVTAAYDRNQPARALAAVTSEHGPGS